MSLHELTAEQRQFAERYHNYVYGFLRWKGLRADDFYDIVKNPPMHSVAIPLFRGKWVLIFGATTLCRPGFLL